MSKKGQGKPASGKAIIRAIGRGDRGRTGAAVDLGEPIE
jgi:hypothetical protein